MAATDRSPSEPDSPADPLASADPQATADPQAPADAETADPADVKARFRDALERKKSQHADGVGTGGPGSSKIHDVHSRAGGKRQFRRKSGG
jgi:hypothetical protein